MKRAVSTTIAAAALAALFVPAASSAAATTIHPAAHSAAAENANRRQENSGRAQEAFAAMQTAFLVDDGSGLYREQIPVEAEDRPYAFEWPFSQAHIAIADLANQPGIHGRQYDEALVVAAAAQEHYWDADGGATGLPGYASYPVGEYGEGGDYFYDDNEWVGLLDVQRFLTDGDEAALSRAEEIFALVVSGWDTDPTHPNPGGVFWTQAPWSSDRNTVSNMPGAQLGLRLYQITGEQYYLDWSLRMYDWTNENLQRPDGLYSDHVDLAGTIEPTVWSYNQGVPVGVNVLLYQATGDERYLAEAERIADAAYRYYVTEGRLDDQPAFFNSIFFKNLLLLESEIGGTTYRSAMQDYADRVWAEQRDPATGLFVFDGEHTQLLEQAAMTQIYAVLAWTPSQWRNLY
ncbi:glycoside hydrolase family 76 protein [Microbacterium sp. M28]|uniref:glycoside hydrolase family 76 protein n=1 Tax=Microbacterium sp. M28 TaxID=2962064 RepID=UPI0021F41373|nr:glycoside hydrolase family 76 protein [Microbacterium sp. M28]UYO97739.1 glycoside hydrolase family 76 protein [Microbacterium sp. M28]